MRASLIIQALAFILIFFVGFACARQSEWKGKAEIIDGVIYVSNPGEPMFKGNPISLEDPLRIGIASGKEEYMFQQIGAIEVDDAGTIYISDWKESHIKVFDRNGVYLKIIGRKGQGPGEFERINRLQIINHNKLVVFDGSRKQFSIFDQNGEYERSIPLQKVSPLDVLISPGRDFLVKTVHLDPVSAKAAIAINLYNDELNLIKTLATDPAQDVLTPFQPYYVWGLTEEAIFLGRNDSYLFSLYDLRGEIQKTISRLYKPVPISPEEKAIRLKKLQQPGNKEVPGHQPAYGSILADNEGHIIVQTYEKPEKGKGYYYDVFDFEGKYLAQMNLEYPPKIWKKGRLYAIGEDDDGFQYLVRYKVRWLI